MGWDNTANHLIISSNYAQARAAVMEGPLRTMCVEPLTVPCATGETPCILGVTTSWWDTLVPQRMDTRWHPGQRSSYDQSHRFWCFRRSRERDLHTREQREFPLIFLPARYQTLGGGNIQPPQHNLIPNVNQKHQNTKNIISHYTPVRRSGSHRQICIFYSYSTHSHSQMPTNHEADVLTTLGVVEKPPHTAL